jgi:hypothetical protein
MKLDSLSKIHVIKINRSYGEKIKAYDRGTWQLDVSNICKPYPSQLFCIHALEHLEDLVQRREGV